jgi:4-amino-4-deoxy-L-arabinose transferase-like glycosyltransferase
MPAIAEPTAADSVEAPSAGVSRSFLRSPFTLVLLITALGCVLRFMYLDRPELWLDEAAVFRRTCGSFHDLLDELRQSGFTPLHYLLYWTIQRFATMTPYVMRTPTALMGTAMVPVMYWLGLQITSSRKTAIVTALFTACSAYMLNYSRDAKMYMPCWLFSALSTACLIWWLRSRLRVAWWSWVVSGLVMLALHATGAMVLCIQLIIYLTHPRLHWKTAIFFVVGLAIIVAPTAVYYQAFSRYYQRTREDWGGESGLSWIGWANGGRDTPQLVLYTTTHFLFAWEWPSPNEIGEVDPRLLRTGEVATLVMLSLFGLGLLPWRRRAGQPPLPWRSMLWIGAWILLPAYGLYCASIPDAWPPWVWPMAILRAFPVPALIGTVLMAASFFYPGRLPLERRALDWLITIGVIAVLFGLCVVVHMITPLQENSLWMPRYIGIAWPAFAIAICALLMRLPTVPIRWMAIAAVLCANLVQHGVRMFVTVEPPTEMIAQDIIDSNQDRAQRRTYFGVRGVPLFTHADRFLCPSGLYYLFVLSHTPVTPATYNDTFDEKFQMFNVFPSAEFAVPMGVSQTPTLRRIVVWDEMDVDPTETSTPDEVLGRLGSGWKLTAERHFRGVDRWTWADRVHARRRVYERP